MKPLCGEQGLVFENKQMSLEKCSQIYLTCYTTVKTVNISIQHTDLQDKRLGFLKESEHR